MKMNTGKEVVQQTSLQRPRGIFQLFRLNGPMWPEIKQDLCCAINIMTANVFPDNQLMCVVCRT